LVKVKQRYIKSENRKWLIGYLLLNLVIFALFSNLINFNLIDANQLISKLKDPQGFIPLTAAILIIVLEGIFKNSVKEFFVFWRFKNRLPGHRAFSHIGPSDPRIDMERVRKLFPHGLPSNPKTVNGSGFIGNIKMIFRSFTLTKHFCSLAT
jgi:hypothetical protein